MVEVYEGAPVAMIWHAVESTAATLHGMVWHGTVWYGMVWYGTVWYGMV